MPTPGRASPVGSAATTPSSFQTPALLLTLVYSHYLGTSLSPHKYGISKHPADIECIIYKRLVYHHSMLCARGFDVLPKQRKEKSDIF